MEEVWKDIPGLEGYYKCDKLGNILSLNYNKTGIQKILKPNKGDRGYYSVQLKGKIYTVHRLIAKTWIPNPDNLPQVNHKDENKLNNRVENLEWCTAKYNINYGTCIQRSSAAQKGFQHSLETKQKISDSLKGKKNYMYGKHHSEETRMKISESQKDKKPVVCLKDNQIIKKYDSIQDTKKDGFTPSNVCRCCKGKLKSYKGFQFSYADDYSADK